MGLHEYQLRAIKTIEEQEAVGLFLEMGLGKTVIALTAAKHLLDDFTVTRVLVIAPLKVAEDTWTREADKWEHLKGLKVVKVLGDRKTREKAAASEADIYVINRDNVKWLSDNYPGDNWRWDMVIIDELSSFKNHKSERFKALRKVRSYIDRIVGLTGTPSPNSYIDLWAQVFLLDGGERLERAIGKYRQLYFTEGKRNGYVVFDWKLKKGADKVIQKKIEDITVSMRAEDYISLPERVEDTRHITLPSQVLKKYRALEQEQILRLEDGGVIMADSAAAVMNKLLQLSGGSVYDSKGDWSSFHDEKLKALDEIAEHERLLVFYGYRHERERLIERYKPRELKGSEDIDDWNNGKIDMLIAHPASVGYGLNLQKGGHVIVWYSLPWSLELYQQANARLYRQGQELPVVITHLIADGTVDQQVLASLKAKDTGQSALMEALSERRRLSGVDKRS